MGHELQGRDRPGENIETDGGAQRRRHPGEGEHAGQAHRHDEEDLKAQGRRPESDLYRRRVPREGADAGKCPEHGDAREPGELPGVVRRARRRRREHQLEALVVELAHHAGNHVRSRGENRAGSQPCPQKARAKAPCFDDRKLPGEERERTTGDRRSGDEPCQPAPCRFQSGESGDDEHRVHGSTRASTSRPISTGVETHTTRSSNPHDGGGVTEVSSASSQPPVPRE